MKKRSMALAALGALACGAQAQDGVNLYGIVDAGIVRETGGAAGSVTNVSSGIGSASRLGLRGSEDLGQGWRANFVLEAGVRVDTGQSDVSGSLFNRQSLVGLSNADFGAVSVGRQYTPYYLALSTVGDPFAAGYAGTAKNLFPAGGSNTRTSNTLYYVSPAVAGVVGELAYAFGEQPGSNTAGRQVGAALGYSAGRLMVRLAHNHRNNDVTAAAGALQVPPVAATVRGIGRNTLLAANYDLGVVKAYAAYGSNKGTNSSPLPNSGNPFGGVPPTPSTDSRDLLLGATVPWGNNTVMASYISKDDRSTFDQDAHQWALGLSHPLSRRTSLYASVAKISNRRGAGYTVGNNTDIGSGDRAWNAGIRHTF